jgi:hypothetical protein
MAPPQSITVIDLLPWPRLTVTAFTLHELENGGQLAPNVYGQTRRGSSRRWRTGSPTHRSATSSASSTSTSAASRRRRAASYAGCVTTTVWSCTTSRRTKSRRRIPANWDLWVHLFHMELHTLTTPKPKVRHAVRTVTTHQGKYRTIA